MSTSKRVMMSRRQFVVGGVAAGAGVVAVAGCAPDSFDGVQQNDVYVERVDAVPVNDPGSSTWEWGPEKIVVMGKQDIALPHKTTPAIAEMSVRAIHDGTLIGFRLEWDDPETNDLTVRVDDFRDACAILLAPGRGDQAMRVMGTATVPATLLHWKADWQRDLDQGVQGLAAVYPNLSIDTYPPLTDSAPGDVDVAAYQRAGATEWLPGVHVGNPMSAPIRVTCVEKALAYGFSTTTTTSVQDARGRGVRSDTGWRVIITKALAPTEEAEYALVPGGFATCAFAVWSGSANDAGSRKAPSASAYRLVLVN